MNIPLHMAVFSLNPKWDAKLDGRGPPCDDLEVLDGFTKAIDKMYPAQEASTLRAKFFDFTKLSRPNLSKPQARFFGTEKSYWMVDLAWERYTKAENTYHLPPCTGC